MVHDVTYTIGIKQCIHSTFPGPPTSPSSLTLHPHFNSELRVLSAVWNTPFSHPNHTISQYHLTVSNIHNSASYEMSIENEKSTNDVMLPLPNSTSACDIVTVTVRAVNDLGPSEPALANISIPQGVYIHHSKQVCIFS